MSVINSKAALRGFLEKKLAADDLRSASTLIARYVSAAVKEDRLKRVRVRPDFQDFGLAKLADVVLNGRRA